MTPPVVERTVSAESGRLDSVLPLLFPELKSRRVARELCEAGKVMVNGRAGRGGQAVNAGDIIALPGGALVPVSADAEIGRPHLGTLITVLFEDDHLLIVEKVRGVPSIRLRQEDPVTVADCLTAHAPETLTASRDMRESGLVNRLDTWTSGLLIAAKSAELWERLRRLIFNGQVEKSYLGFVEGSPGWSWTECERSIRQSERSEKMEIAEKGAVGAPARTELERVGVLEEAGKQYAVIRAHASRARRHQVRLHLSTIGFPLVGDSLYGAREALPEALARFNARAEGEGFLLHAERIAFTHPLTSEQVDVRSTSALFSALIERSAR